MMNRAYVRLASGYIILIVVVFLVIGIYLIHLINQHEFESWQQRIQRENQIAATAISALEPADASAVNLLLERLDVTSPGQLAIVGPDGTILAGSTTRTSRQLATAPEIVSALNGNASTETFQNPNLNRTEHGFTEPIQLDDGSLVVLLMTVPDAEAPGRWTPLTQFAASVLILAAIGIAAVSSYMPRIITQPLAELTAIARRISSGDLDVRASTDTYDEVAELAEAFNEMTGELREQIVAVEHERSRLAAIVEHLNDGVIVVDPRGAIRLINRSAERLLGIDRERALVRSYTEVIRDHELVGLIRDSSLLYNPERELPNRFIELGRPRRSVQAFAYPIVQAGNQLVFVILRDITELRRTEVIRRDFVANVSHDLRTPIASLKALVETLLDGALEDDTVARDFLSRMEVEVDDLARLVEELLELSRAESRRIELHQIPADISNVVRRCVSRLRTHAEPKAISFDLNLPEDLPRAFVDPERIEQVLVNLLHNATKFSPPDETVTISASVRDHDLLVCVVDRGPGIPPDELDRVFERFYKSDQSRSNTGSGLGLAIARHLVQLHGGQIWAESGYRGGTSFCFTVPKANQEQSDWLDEG